MPHAQSKLIVTMLMGILTAPLAANIFLTDREEAGNLSSSIVDVKDAVSMRRDTARAIQDRTRDRLQQRQYWSAMKVYQNMLRDGVEGMTPPDVNDYQSILLYLEGDKNVAAASELVHSAAEDEDVIEEVVEEEVEDIPTSSLMVEDLGMEQRHLLRRYERANNCPESLKNYWLEGFYELCLSVTKAPTTEPRRGLMNVMEWLRGRNAAPAPTMKLRMQMLEQALDRSNRRESEEPGRPAPYIKQD
ncbi:hypothetical protein KKF55_05075 [Patescibacteria group bacterium]|nr:hypothetical protein [Patescibacteria group bacterium]